MLRIAIAGATAVIVAAAVILVVSFVILANDDDRDLIDSLAADPTAFVAQDLVITGEVDEVVPENGASVALVMETDEGSVVVVPEAGVIAPEIGEGDIVLAGGTVDVIGRDSDGGAEILPESGVLDRYEGSAIVQASRIEPATE